MKRVRWWGVLEFAVAIIIIALVIGIAVALVPPAHAEENSKSVTGIPVEYLFLTIGTLVAAIYADIKHALGALKREAGHRGRHIRRVENAVRLVCNKLQIKYEGLDDE